MASQPHICMLAAENDALPGGKVGGIGDVIRDVPAALAATGAKVTVIVPSYGTFHKLPGTRKLGTASVTFMGFIERVDVYSVKPGSSEGVQQIVLEHPRFSACGAGNIYCNDGADRPFATDANKFALFSHATLRAIVDDLFGTVDVLHLHDWHAAFAAILVFYDPSYAALKPIPRVFSIHNLAMQGIRPLVSDESSWQNWFSGFPVAAESITDPRFDDCVNPVAGAIRLSDKVHTVSPTYAREIQQPNDATRGFHGGEGLEADLNAAAREDRLVGILNGIEYEERRRHTPKRISRTKLWETNMKMIRDYSLSWVGETDPMLAVHYLAHHRALAWLEGKRPAHIVTSVGRLTDQKMAIALHTMADGRTALEHMLDRLAKDNGVFILLGSGTKDLEVQCQAIAAAHENCLFLNRYAAPVADALFEFGDLFFMPSSFEPCGISQLIAMRHGQPCLVHAVGGLRDTIVDGIDGFQFGGTSPQEQAENCIARFDEAITLHKDDQEGWSKLQATAKSRRFTWSASAEQYRELLYRDAE
jgi:starch synthase